MSTAPRARVSSEPSSKIVSPQTEQQKLKSTAATVRLVPTSKIVSPQIEQQLKAVGVAQVIVVLKRPVQLAATARAATTKPTAGLEQCFQTSERSQMSAIARAGYALGVRGARAGGAAAAAAPAVAPVRHYPNLGVMLGTVTSEGLEGLKESNEVELVTGTPQFSLIWPQRVSAAKLAAKVTWGIERLGINKLWKQGLRGKHVRVAHLDTGVDGQHPALRKAIAAFAEFDFLGQRINPSPKPHDSDDHGTHTAATIAGRKVQGKSIGVAPQADLVSALVIEGGDVVARVLGGIDWALENEVRVLSMSLGFRGWWEDFIPIVQILRENDVLPVIAVGNEGPGTSRSPGNYPNVVSVGATNKQGEVAEFSSSQTFTRVPDPLVPDLVAPGVDVISARPGGGYQSMDGTSMATPHIAGLAALLFGAVPSATANAVEDAIFRSCQQTAGIDPERGNRGFPDAATALSLLTGN